MKMYAFPCPTSFSTHTTPLHLQSLIPNHFVNRHEIIDHLDLSTCYDSDGLMWVRK